MASQSASGDMPGSDLEPGMPGRFPGIPCMRKRNGKSIPDSRSLPPAVSSCPARLAVP